MINSGVDPKRIVAMTFTNKAAREMAERVKELVPKGSTKQMPFMGTFHSFCLRMLREYPGRAGLTKGFSLDESGQTHVVQIVGERHTVKPFDRPMPAEIVVIGRRGQLDREKLSRLGGTGT